MPLRFIEYREMPVQSHATFTNNFFRTTEGCKDLIALVSSVFEVKDVFIIVYFRLILISANFLPSKISKIELSTLFKAYKISVFPKVTSLVLLLGIPLTF